MLRRFIVVCAVAVGLSCLASFGVAQAQIDTSNETVQCNILQKTAIKASPALILGGTQPTTLKLKGKLAGCTSSAGGFTIPDSKSTVSAVLSLPSNDCSALITGLPASGSIIIKWKASAKIAPAVSTITVDNQDLTAGLFSAPWSVSYGYLGLGVNSRPNGTPGTALAVSGAFTGGDGGSTSTAALVTQEDLNNFFDNHCFLTGLAAFNIGIGQVHLG